MTAEIKRFEINEACLRVAVTLSGNTYVGDVSAQCADFLGEQELLNFDVTWRGEEPDEEAYSEIREAITRYVASTGGGRVYVPLSELLEQVEPRFVKRAVQEIVPRLPDSVASQTLPDSNGLRLCDAREVHLFRLCCLAVAHQLILLDQDQVRQKDGDWYKDKDWGTTTRLEYFAHVLNDALVQKNRFCEQRFGYITRDGDWLVEPRFEDAWAFDRGYAQVRENGVWGVIRKDGSWLAPPDSADFEEWSGFEEGLAPVVRDGRAGFLDENGNWAIEPRFGGISGFSRGIAMATNDDDLCGYIDKSGVWVIPPQFEMAYYFSEDDDIAGVERNGRWGFINRSGEWVIEPRFEQVSNFYGGLAAVCVGELWGFVDKTGSMVLQPQFESADFFDEHGMAIVQKDGLWGLIDTTGKWLLEPVCDFVFDFCETSHFAAQMHDLWGVLDARGEWLIEPFLEDVTPDDDSLWRAKTNGVYGFIAPSGEWIIKPQFDDAQPFEGSFAAVKKDGLWGYIDRSGQWSIEPKFDTASAFCEGLAMVRKDTFCGYIDEAGRCVKTPELVDGSDFADSVAYVSVESARLQLPNLSELRILCPRHRPELATGMDKELFAVFDVSDCFDLKPTKQGQSLQRIVRKDLTEFVSPPWNGD